MAVACSLVVAIAPWQIILDAWRLASRPWNFFQDAAMPPKFVVVLEGFAPNQPGLRAHWGLALGRSVCAFFCLFGQLVGRKFHCQLLPVSVLWCTAEPQWACGIEATTGSFVCFLGPGCPVNRVGYENHNEASCIPMGPALL